MIKHWDAVAAVFAKTVVPSRFLRQLGESAFKTPENENKQNCLPGKKEKNCIVCIDLFLFFRWVGGLWPVKIIPLILSGVSR